MSDIAMILDRIGKTLAIDVSPHLDGHYAGGHVVISGLMAVMAGEAFDGTVDRMLHEISDMRTLLVDGGMEPGDTRGTSMKVSALQLVHDRLSNNLIGMQTDLESKTDNASKALNARIWQFYAEGAQARMPALPEIAEARAKAAARIAAEKTN
jgi:hypothetical protein